MHLLTNSVGRKVLMAVTGFCLLFFIIVHLLGNSTIWIGPDGINAYAAALHSMGPFVWAFRLVMLAILLVHILFAVLLTLENWAANPEKYAVKKMLKASFAGETMIWTGLLLLAFIVYHLLQFTAKVTPDIVEGIDAKGRIDVFTMVINSLRITPISVVYLAAVVILFLHLSHGIQSIFQSIGLTNDKALPVYDGIGKGLSVIFLLGYGAIPVLILVGILAR